jgi:hypothetical protein
MVIYKQNMNSKITLMAVVLAVGAAMVIATSNAAFALPPKESTETEKPNKAITVTTTTECANPGEQGPQPHSERCPNEKFETVTECEATNKGQGSPAGHEKDCPEGT